MLDYEQFFGKPPSGWRLYTPVPRTKKVVRKDSLLGRTLQVYYAIAWLVFGTNCWKGWVQRNWDVISSNPKWRQVAQRLVPSLPTPLEIHRKEHGETEGSLLGLPIPQGVVPWDILQEKGLPSGEQLQTAAAALGCPCRTGVDPAQLAREIEGATPGDVVTFSGYIAPRNPSVPTQGALGVFPSLEEVRAQARADLAAIVQQIRGVLQQGGDTRSFEELLLSVWRGDASSWWQAQKGEMSWRRRAVALGVDGYLWWYRDDWKELLEAFMDSLPSWIREIPVKQVEEFLRAIREGREVAYIETLVEQQGRSYVEEYLCAAPRRKVQEVLPPMVLQLLEAGGFSLGSAPSYYTFSVEKSSDGFYSVRVACTTGTGVSRITVSRVSLERLSQEFFTGIFQFSTTPPTNPEAFSRVVLGLGRQGEEEQEPLRGSPIAKWLSMQVQGEEPLAVSCFWIEFHALLGRFQEENQKGVLPSFLRKEAQRLLDDVQRLPLGGESRSLRATLEEIVACVAKEEEARSSVASWIRAVSSSPTMEGPTRAFLWGLFGRRVLPYLNYFQVVSPSASSLSWKEWAISWIEKFLWWTCGMSLSDWTSSSYTHQVRAVIALSRLVKGAVVPWTFLVEQQVWIVSQIVWEVFCRCFPHQVAKLEEMYQFCRGYVIGRIGQYVVPKVVDAAKASDVLNWVGKQVQAHFVRPTELPSPKISVVVPPIPPPDGTIVKTPPSFSSLVTERNDIVGGGPFEGVTQLPDLRIDFPSPTSGLSLSAILKMIENICEVLERNDAQARSNHARLFQKLEEWALALPCPIRGLNQAKLQLYGDHKLSLEKVSRLLWLSPGRASSGTVLARILSAKLYAIGVFVAIEQGLLRATDTLYASSIVGFASQPKIRFVPEPYREALEEVLRYFGFEKEGDTWQREGCSLVMLGSDPDSWIPYLQERLGVSLADLGRDPLLSWLLRLRTWMIGYAGCPNLGESMIEVREWSWDQAGLAFYLSDIRQQFLCDFSGFLRVRAWVREEDQIPRGPIPYWLRLRGGSYSEERGPPVSIALALGAALEALQEERWTWILAVSFMDVMRTPNLSQYVRNHPMVRDDFARFFEKYFAQDPEVWCSKVVELYFYLQHVIEHAQKTQRASIELLPPLPSVERVPLWFLFSDEDPILAYSRGRRYLSVEEVQWLLCLELRAPPSCDTSWLDFWKEKYPEARVPPQKESTTASKIPLERRQAPPPPPSVLEVEIPSEFLWVDWTAFWTGQSLEFPKFGHRAEPLPEGGWGIVGTPLRLSEEFFPPPFPLGVYLPLLGSGGQRVFAVPVQEFIASMERFAASKRGIDLPKGVFDWLGNTSANLLAGVIPESWRSGVFSVFLEETNGKLRSKDPKGVVFLLWLAFERGDVGEMGELLQEFDRLSRQGPLENGCEALLLPLASFAVIVADPVVQKMALHLFASIERNRILHEREPISFSWLSPFLLYTLWRKQGEDSPLLPPLEERDRLLLLESFVRGMGRDLGEFTSYGEWVQERILPKIVPLLLPPELLREWEELRGKGPWYLILQKALLPQGGVPRKRKARILPAMMEAVTRAAVQEALSYLPDPSSGSSAPLVLPPHALELLRVLLARPLEPLSSPWKEQIQEAYEQIFEDPARGGKILERFWFLTLPVEVSRWVELLYVMHYSHAMFFPKTWQEATPERLRKALLLTLGIPSGASLARAGFEYMAKPSWATVGVVATAAVAGPAIAMAGPAIALAPHILKGLNRVDTAARQVHQIAAAKSYKDSQREREPLPLLEELLLWDQDNHAAILRGDLSREDLHRAVEELESLLVEGRKDTWRSNEDFVRECCRRVVGGDRKWVEEQTSIPFEMLHTWISSYMLLQTRLRQVERLERLRRKVEAAADPIERDMATHSLAQEREASRGYGIGPHAMLYLLFEFSTGMLLQNSQVARIERAIQSPGLSILEAPTGSGKTAALDPLIAATFAEQQGAVVCLPSNQFHVQGPHLVGQLADLGVVATLFSLSRDTTFSLHLLEEIERMLQRGSVVICTTETLETLQLAFIELSLKDPKDPSLDLFRRIFALLKNMGVLFDEAHETLSRNATLRFPLGTKAVLDPLWIDSIFVLCKNIVERRGVRIGQPISQRQWEGLAREVAEELSRGSREIAAYLAGGPPTPQIEARKDKELLDLYRAMLCSVFPGLLFQAQLWRTYGPGDDDDIAIPYRANMIPEKGAEFQNPLAILFFSLSMLLQRGLTKAQMTRLRKEVQSPKKRASRREKDMLRQIAPLLLQKESSFAFPVVWAYFELFVVPKVAFYEKSLVSTPERIVSLFRSAVGLTATPNPRDAPASAQFLWDAQNAEISRRKTLSASVESLLVIDAAAVLDALPKVPQLGAIADVGAFFAGMSSLEVARRLYEIFQKPIVFLDEKEGVWKVWTRNGSEPYITMPPGAITYYTQDACFGSDLDLPPNTTLVATCGSHTTMSDMIQALGRARKAELKQMRFHIMCSSRTGCGSAEELLQRWERQVVPPSTATPDPWCEKFSRAVATKRSPVEPLVAQFGDVVADLGRDMHRQQRQVQQQQEQETEEEQEQEQITQQQQQQRRRLPPLREGEASWPPTQTLDNPDEFLPEERRGWGHNTTLSPATSVVPKAHPSIFHTNHARGVQNTYRGGLDPWDQRRVEIPCILVVRERGESGEWKYRIVWLSAEDAAFWEQRLVHDRKRIWSEKKPEPPCRVALVSLRTGSVIATGTHSLETEELFRDPQACELFVESLFWTGHISLGAHPHEGSPLRQAALSFLRRLGPKEARKYWEGHFPIRWQDTAWAEICREEIPF